MDRLAPHIRAGLDQRMLRRFDALSLPPGAAITIAFSGGGDSLALALTLSRLRDHRSFQPYLLHIDHQLWAGSAKDAETANQLAHDLELPIVQWSLQPGLPGRAKALGIEGAARSERYEALARMTRELNASIMATGHHQGDQTETVLLHLFRGSGLKGLAGMQELSQWPTSNAAPDLRVWRPFLSEPKAVLADYLRSAGFTALHDPSNDDVRFRRNAIRHTILPLIEKDFPGAESALARLANVVREDSEYLDAFAVAHMRDLIGSQGELSVAGLSAAPPAIATRVVRQWLLDRGIEEPTYERTREVLDFARKPEDFGPMEVGSGRLVLRDGELLLCGLESTLLAVLCNRSGVLPLYTEQPIEPVVMPSGRRRFEFSSGWVEIKAVSSRSGILAFQGNFPETISPGAITVRRTRMGDIWHDSHEPVKEALRVAGVHPFARWKLACVACDNMVIALPGITRGAGGSQTARLNSGLSIEWGLAKEQE